MKKVLHLMTLFIALLMVGCINEEPIVEQTTSSLTLSFHFNKLNNGESMTKAGGNSAIFEEFYTAISDGSLTASNYDLQFTEVKTGESFQLKGSWNTKESIEIKMGTYNVRGRATASGKYLQKECSLVIDCDDIVIDRDDAAISLLANYDCALIIFADESLASVVNHTEDSEESLFEFGKYFYTFVNTTICNKATESYLLGTRTNGSQFTIPTDVQPFDKGKFYVYDTTKTNSFASDVVIPEMEEGQTGVVAQLGDNITIYDLKYDGFTVDVELNSSIKEQNHVIKWAMGDIYTFNRNINFYYTPMSTADMLTLHDTVWGGINLFNESTTIVIDEEHAYYVSDDIRFWDKVVPGQPCVIMFGEFAYGESLYGWGYGYYRPLFNSFEWEQAVSNNGGKYVDDTPYWTGMNAKSIVTTKQPTPMGDHITQVLLEGNEENATIKVVVDSAVKEVCVAVYDDASLMTTMEYLDNNPDYRQWFATSNSAEVMSIAKRLTPDSNGVVEIDIKNNFDVDYNYWAKYTVDVVALAGDYNNDGIIDGTQQHYESHTISPCGYKPVTMQYFNEVATTGDGFTYILTGKITEVANTLYGNFYFEDETGTAYVYGLLTPEGEAQKQWAAAGLKVNDVITVMGARADYKGDPQMTNAVYVSHEVGEASPIVDATIAEFLAAEKSGTQYRISGVVTNIANAEYGNLYIKDATGEVYVYGVGAKGEFETMGVEVGDIVTLISNRGEYNGTPQAANSTLEKKEDVTAVASVTDFLALEESGAYYMLTGTVSGMAGAGEYGSIYLNDEASSIYVYGLLSGYKGEKKQFPALVEATGLKDGDELTIVGKRISYNGTAQVGSAFYFSHTSN